MNFHEKVFLLYKAHLLWDMQRRAAAQGHVFTPSNRFDPISPPPLEAQARIFCSGNAELALAIRQPVKRTVSDAVVAHCAALFFGDAAFEPGGVEETTDHVTSVFVSKTIIPSILPITLTA